MIKEGDPLVCPNCNGSLKLYDHAKRMVRLEYGTVKYLRLRRFKCVACKKVHRELPNYLMPYKQFNTKVIKEVVDGVITPYDLEFEDYPCEMTMKRWIREYGDKD